MNSTLLIDKKNDLWRNFENCILEVTKKALLKLRSKFPTIPEKTVYGNKKEDILTHVLCESITEVLFETREKNEHCKSRPFFNAPNQPLKDDLNSPHVLKKPDLQWSKHNELADCYEAYQITYSIECKLLGILKGRRLPYYYYEEGIKRFISSDHRYADGFPSAAMLGYFLNDDFQVVLTEINGYLKADIIEEIILEDTDWQPESVTCLIHNIDKGIRSDFPIKLRHLWIDLR